MFASVGKESTQMHAEGNAVNWVWQSAANQKETMVSNVNSHPAWTNFDASDEARDVQLHPRAV